jgi:hypothetical protein
MKWTEMDSLDRERYLLRLLSASIQLLALLATFGYLSQSIVVSLVDAPISPFNPSLSVSDLLRQVGFLNRRGRLVRGTLIAVSSLAWLWLYFEAYNIARPIYVCMYPVRGEYRHHPHETRMRIQYICYFAAAVLAAGTVLYDLYFVGSTYRTLMDRMGAIGAMERDYQAEKKNEDRKEEVALAHEELSDRELVERWKKLKFRRDLFMLCAGIAGTMGCLVISGMDRYRFFEV